MRRHLILIALLSLVVLLLLDNATDRDAETEAPLAADGQADHDYVLSGADSTYFQPDGRTRYRLRTRRLTHYPEPERSVLEAPELELYGEDGLPWTVTAEQGQVAHALGLAERVDLSGRVHVSRVDESGRPLDLYTDFLQLWPDEAIAATDHEVHLETAGGWLTGQGMRADMENEHVQLLGNGRGNYEP